MAHHRLIIVEKIRIWYLILCLKNSDIFDLKIPRRSHLTWFPIIAKSRNIFGSQRSKKI